MLSSGSRVGGNGQHAGDDDEPGEACGVVAEDPEPDQAPPVLRGEGDGVEACRRRPSDLRSTPRGAGTGSPRCGPACPSGPSRCGRGRSPGAHRRRAADHGQVEVRPGRLVLQEQDDRYVGAACVDVVHAQPVDGDVVGLVAPTQQIGEALLGVRTYGTPGIARAQLGVTDRDRRGRSNVIPLGCSI